MESDRITDGQEPQVDEAEPRKPARRILEQEIAEGLGELERSTTGLFISGLSAGLDVSFSVLLLGVTMTLAEGQISELWLRLLTAGMYAIGFIFVIMGRSELFTEHTTLATLPVLNGRATLGSLARLWVIVYFANFIGTVIFAVFIANIGPALGIIRPDVLVEIADGLVRHSWWIILFSAVLAGWLMGLLSWMIAASRDTISQILLIGLITGAIGFSHLHHAVVGNTEVLAGLFSGPEITLADFGHFALWTTLGNSIGGVVFVALIKYGHVILGPDDDIKVDLEDGPALKRNQRANRKIA